MRDKKIFDNNKKIIILKNINIIVLDEEYSILSFDIFKLFISESISK